MSLQRLNRGDWIAWLAALALLIVMSLDWWGSTLGDDFRRTESLAPTNGAEAGEVGRKLSQTAALAAESQEHNAWQPRKLVDGVILIVLLLAVAWSLAAVWAKAAGKRYDMSLNAVAGIAAAVGGVLVAYRMVQEPGIDELTTVKLGAPLAVLSCVALSLAHSSALRADEEPAPVGHQPAEGEPPAAAEPEAPAAT